MEGQNFCSQGADTGEWKKMQGQNFYSQGADMGEWKKNARQNQSRRSFQSSFALLMLDVYHCLADSIREKGNNFHLRV
jgi:hypothetical protein